MNSTGINFGEFLEQLKRLDPETKVKFDFGSCIPCGHHSYRGYYDDIALGCDFGERKTAQELIDYYEPLIGTEMYGYKGGDYTIDKDTYMWVSYDSSDCSGTVVNYIKNLGYGLAIIMTGYED